MIGVLNLIIIVSFCFLIERIDKAWLFVGFVCFGIVFGFWFDMGFLPIKSLSSLS